MPAVLRFILLLVGGGVVLSGWMYVRSGDGHRNVESTVPTITPSPATAGQRAEDEKLARQRAERERADKLYEGVRLLYEARKEAVKFGLEKTDLDGLVSRVGIPAVRHYLLTCKRPYDKFESGLAYRIVVLTSSESVYETLMIAMEVGLGGEIVYGPIHSRLVAKCLLDHDRDAHEFLQEFPVIKQYMSVAERDFSTDGGVIEILVQAGLSFSDIINSYSAVGRPDWDGAIDAWIFGGGVNRMVAASGNLQRILEGLGSVDPFFRVLAIGKLEEPGVSKREYLERNPWIKGEDLKAYAKSWVASSPEEALDWLRDHDREVLPSAIRSAFPNHSSHVLTWGKRQTDPEITRMCEKAQASWEKAERKNRIR